MIDAISLWCGDGCGCGQTTTVVAVVVVTIASNWRLRVYSRKMEAAWVRQQDRDFDRRHETAKSAFRRFIFYAHSPYCLFGGPTRWSLSRLNGFSIYIFRKMLNSPMALFMWLRACEWREQLLFFGSTFICRRRRHFLAYAPLHIGRRQGQRRTSKTQDRRRDKTTKLNYNKDKVSELKTIKCRHFSSFAIFRSLSVDFSFGFSLGIYANIRRCFDRFSVRQNTHTEIESDRESAKQVKNSIIEM